MIFGLLEHYVGLDKREAEDFFDISENDTDYVLKARRWLEIGTFNAMKRLVKDKAGSYTPPSNANGAIFQIPKTKPGVTPDVVSLENQRINSEHANKEAIPTEETYSLKKSSEKLGKLYPVLKDAKGNIIDGRHRKEIDPHWPSLTCHDIDTPIKLHLARLTANFCRRTVPKEELEENIGFLIGAGLKPEKIAEETGISPTTVYRHMPPELKKPEARKISEAMKKKSEVVRKELALDRSYPTTQELEPCEACSLGTTEVKQWHGHKLCLNCYGKALLKPELFEAKFNRAPKARPDKSSKPAKAWKETAEHRRAIMHPPVSKFDLAFDVEATKAGLPHGESQVEICVVKTRPDKRWFLPKGQLIAYWDGPVHKGREDRDEKLRDFLRKRPNIEVLEYDYETPSDKAVKEAVELARTKLLEMGWKDKHE